MAYLVYVGETHIKPTWTVEDESGNAVSLQGATVAVEWQPQRGVSFTGGGSATVSSTSPYNVITYTMVAADTLTPGTYFVQPQATFSDGSVLKSIAPITITVASLAPNA